MKKLIEYTINETEIYDAIEYILKKKLVGKYIKDEADNKYKINKAYINYYDDDDYNINPKKYPVYCNINIELKGTINTDFDLYLYDDTEIEKSINILVNPELKLTFSESGMQGRYYLNFDCSIHF